MQLVLIHSEGDEIHGSYDITTPIEYASAEQFLVDFDLWCIENKNTRYFDYCSGFLGTNITPSNQGEVTVFELAEWFEKCKPNSNF